MSGGSFEYLCFDVEDTDKILSTPERLRKMEAYLRARGKHDIADEVLCFCLNIETHMRQLLAMGNRMTDILLAVEWWASCDWGEDQVDKAWHKFLWGKENVKES
jgi:hypothetical protein